jgi:hypothetical protein
MLLHTKKQYELLPPEKKARLMATKAKQCHEHLTEEEKKFSAQIKSVIRSAKQDDIHGASNLLLPYPGS